MNSGADISRAGRGRRPRRHARAGSRPSGALQGVALPTNSSGSPPRWPSATCRPARRSSSRAARPAPSSTWCETAPSRSPTSGPSTSSRGGAVFGHPSLLTGPGARVHHAGPRRRPALYCIPGELALEILSRTDGVGSSPGTCVTGSSRRRARSAPCPACARPPVPSLLHGAPQFCAPDTPIRDAAQLSWTASRSAVLVRMPEGLGIVTDVDLRDKVVAPAPRATPRSGI